MRCGQCGAKGSESGEPEQRGSQEAGGEPEQRGPQEAGGKPERRASKAGEGRGGPSALFCRAMPRPDTCRAAGRSPRPSPRRRWAFPESAADRAAPDG